MKQPRTPWPMKVLALPIRIPYLLIRLLIKSLYIIGIVAWKKLTRTNISRRVGNTLHMPITTLSHRQTKNKIVLFGMVHIGNKEYYQKVQALVVSLEGSGYQILYERVKKSSEEELAQLTKKEKKVFRAIERLSKDMKKVATTLRLEYQSDGITIGERWVNTDMTTVDLVKKLARGLKFTHKKIDYAKEDEPFIRWSLGKAILNIELFQLLSVFRSKKQQLKDRLLKAVIVGGRDTIAVEEIIRFSDRNVVALWGANHLPGIIKSLRKEYGYRIVHREWVPACTRTYFFKDMVKDMMELKQKKYVEQEAH